MKCFYHSADLDGHCSGAIVYHCRPHQNVEHQNVEMVGINYGQDFPFDTILPGEVVFMVDFCLQPFDLMERLNSICELHWIDHHKTAIIESAARNFVASGGQLLVDGQAACELTWEYLLRDLPEVLQAFWDISVPLGVTLLGRYDVWDHSDPRTLPFQYGMRILKNTLPQSDVWLRVFLHDNTFVEQIIETGKTLILYEANQNEKFCNAYAFETTLKEDRYSAKYPAICINRGFTNSQVFDSVYDPDKHSLMITFCRLKPPAHKWTVSLYSTRDDVDCGSIARSFGGGGHKGAAGFQCESLPFDY